MGKNSNIPAIKKNIVYGQQKLTTIFEYLIDFTDEKINNTIKILR